MSKSEEVKKQIEHLQCRITNLSNTQDRMSMFDGMNDGVFLDDNSRRLKRTKDQLKKYIADNVEYVL